MKYPKSPRLGDIVWVRRFAFFPIKTKSNHWIWLRWYLKKRQYVLMDYNDLWGICQCKDWITIENCL